MLEFVHVLEIVCIFILYLPVIYKATQDTFWNGVKREKGKP